MENRPCHAAGPVAALPHDTTGAPLLELHVGSVLACRLCITPAGICLSEDSLNGAG